MFCLYLWTKLVSILISFKKPIKHVVTKKCSCRFYRFFCFFVFSRFIKILNQTSTFPFNSKINIDFSVPYTTQQHIYNNQHQLYLLYNNTTATTPHRFSSFVFVIKKVDTPYPPNNLDPNPINITSFCPLAVYSFQRAPPIPLN